MKFNKEKHYLGKLCKRKHNYNGTGKSWKRISDNRCIECTELYSQTEKRKKYRKLYRIKNKDRIFQQDKLYVLRNKEKIKTYNKQWRENNPEKVNKACKKYYHKNKEKRSESSKQWRKNNPETVKEQYKQWVKNNPEMRRGSLKKARIKMRSTPKGRIGIRMSSSIRRSLKNGKNGNRWENLVGYTTEDLKIHLAKLFTDEMNWELFMQGKIHIDHIIPISVFKFNSYDDIDFKRCWALGNLQPLWAKDNLIKNNHIEKDFQPNLLI